MRDRRDFWRDEGDLKEEQTAGVHLLVEGGRHSRFNKDTKDIIVTRMFQKRGS